MWSFGWYHKGRSNLPGRSGVTDRKKLSLALLGMLAVTVLLAALFLALVVSPLRSGPWREIVGIPERGHPGCMREAHRVDSIPFVNLDPDQVCDSTPRRP